MPQGIVRIVSYAGAGTFGIVGGQCASERAAAGSMAAPIRRRTGKVKGFIKLARYLLRLLEDLRRRHVSAKLGLCGE
jgi:hypothetical protein